MGAAYSQDLRDRVLAAYDRGMQTKQIAGLFQVSPAWARRVKQRLRDTGETSPRPMGGRRSFKIDRERLRELVAQKPDATLRELRDMLGIECAESAICMALKRLKFSFKKRRSTRKSRIVRTWRRVEPTGGPRNPSSTPDDSSSSTRPGPRPT
jgi:transposase